MTLEFWFWVLYVIAIVFGFWMSQQTPPNPRFVLGTPLLYFVLLGILGWAEFGQPVHR